MFRFLLRLFEGERRRRERPGAEATERPHERLEPLVNQVEGVVADQERRVELLEQEAGLFKRGREWRDRRGGHSA